MSEEKTDLPCPHCLMVDAVAAEYPDGIAAVMVLLARSTDSSRTGTIVGILLAVILNADVGGTQFLHRLGEVRQVLGSEDLRDLGLESAELVAVADPAAVGKLFDSASDALGGLGEVIAVAAQDEVEELEARAAEVEEDRKSVV